MRPRIVYKKAAKGRIMPKSTQERLNQVERQIEKSKKEKAQLKAKIRSQKRKADARRKILIGAAIESLLKQDTGGLWMKEGEKLHVKTLQEVLDKVITNKSDREFLGLKPIEPPKENMEDIFAWMNDFRIGENR